MQKFTTKFAAFFRGGKTPQNRKRRKKAVHGFRASAFSFVRNVVPVQKAALFISRVYAGGGDPRIRPCRVCGAHRVQAVAPAAFAVRCGRFGGHRGDPSFRRDPSRARRPFDQCRLCGRICGALVALPRYLSLYRHGGDRVGVPCRRQSFACVPSGRRAHPVLFIGKVEGGYLCAQVYARCRDRHVLCIGYAVCRELFSEPECQHFVFALFVLFGTFGARDERYTRFFRIFHADLRAECRSSA